MRGGIAERGGVRVGHRIIEINGQSVVAVPHERIVNLLATSVGEVKSHRCCGLTRLNLIGFFIHFVYSTLFSFFRFTWKQCRLPCFACWPAKKAQYSFREKFPTLHCIALFVRWIIGEPPTHPRIVRTPLSASNIITQDKKQPLTVNWKHLSTLARILWRPHSFRKLFCLLYFLSINEIWDLFKPMFSLDCLSQHVSHTCTQPHSHSHTRRHTDKHLHHCFLST